jgi:hypothetical protein
MNESTNSRLASRGVLWRSGLCLLLAVLFLYNPFFTIHGSSHVLKVQDSLSFRSTVASSELRRFTLSPLQFSFDPSEQAVAANLVVPAVPSSCDPHAKLVRLLVLQQSFLSSFWSRPPPTR